METTLENKPGPFKEVWLITLGHGLTHWYPATFYLILPFVGKDLGLNFTQIGFIITFQFIASTISNIPGGMLVDTIGKKGLLMALSLFWVGIPYLLMNFTSSYLILLFLISLVGIGNNLWHPTAISTLSQQFPERKGLVLSIHGMGANVGDALAPLAIGALLGTLNWRAVVVINILPGAIMASLVLIFLRNLRVASKDKENLYNQSVKGIQITKYIKGLKDLFHNKSLIVISASSGFRSMTQNALLTFLPLFLLQELNYSPFWVGTGMFLLQAGGFIAAPIAGYLSDKLGRRKITTTSMIMTAVILVFMAILGRSSCFIFFIAILGFFLYAIRPVLQAWIIECTPKEMAGTSIGILFGMQSLGSSISPLIGGIIADKFGLFGTFYFITTTIILANLFIFLMPNETDRNEKHLVA